MDHTITPSIPELQEQVSKLTQERDTLKIELRKETARANREVTENGVLDSIVDKLIDKLAAM